MSDGAYGRLFVLDKTQDKTMLFRSVNVPGRVKAPLAGRIANTLCFRSPELRPGRFFFLYHHYGGYRWYSQSAVRNRNLGN